MSQLLSCSRGTLKKDAMLLEKKLCGPWNKPGSRTTAILIAYDSTRRDVSDRDFLRTGQRGEGLKSFRVRKDAMTLLHGEQMEPFRAPLNVVAAHDTLQGFSPAQCFGRNFTIDGRLFESEQTVPVLQGMNDPRHAFGKSMNARLAAEEVYRKSQASFQLSRALNMKTRPQRVYLPGDLVYYRREKAPADTPAHEELGIPKARMARWWGPARVLSSETRSDELTRLAAQVVWIVAAGRLKRCSPDQLQHASEREVILANSTHDTITPGWTFHSLLQGMQAGNFDIYDNYQLPEDRAAVSRKGAASKPPRSRTPAREPKESNQEPGMPMKNVIQEPKGPTRAATASKEDSGPVAVV